MAEIKTRPATPEFREGYDRIFGGYGGARPPGDVVLLRDDILTMTNDGGIAYVWPDGSVHREPKTSNV